MSKIIYSVEDCGTWIRSGLGKGAEGMTWRQLRSLQQTLIRAVTGLEDKIQTMIPESERLNQQIDLDRIILVKTAHVEIESAHFMTAAQVAALAAIDDCDIQIEPEPVTHPWLLEKLRDQAEEARHSRCVVCTKNVIEGEGTEKNETTGRLFHSVCADAAATYYTVTLDNQTGCTWPTRSEAELDITVGKESDGEEGEWAIEEVTMTPREYAALPEFQGF